MIQAKMIQAKCNLQNSGTISVFLQSHLKVLVKKVFEKASLSCAINQLGQTAPSWLFNSFLSPWLNAPVTCRRQLALSGNPSASDNGTISSSITAQKSIC